MRLCNLSDNLLIIDTVKNEMYSALNQELKFFIRKIESRKNWIIQDKFLMGLFSRGRGSLPRTQQTGSLGSQWDEVNNPSYLCGRKPRINCVVKVSGIFVYPGRLYDWPAVVTCFHLFFFSTTSRNILAYRAKRCEFFPFNIPPLILLLTRSVYRHRFTVFSKSKA